MEERVYGNASDERFNIITAQYVMDRLGLIKLSHVEYGSLQRAVFGDKTTSVIFEEYSGGNGTTEHKLTVRSESGIANLEKRLSKEMERLGIKLSANGPYSPGQQIENDDAH